MVYNTANGNLWLTFNKHESNNHKPYNQELSINLENDNDTSLTSKFIYYCGLVGTIIGIMLCRPIVISLGWILGASCFLVKTVFSYLASICFLSNKHSCENFRDSIINWATPFVRSGYYAIEVPLKNLINLIFAGGGLLISIPAAYITNKINAKKTDENASRRTVLEVQPIYPSPFQTKTLNPIAKNSPLYASPINREAKQLQN
jgi:hypothetical protein